MLVKIANHPRNYAWGSRTLVGDYFGAEAFGGGKNEPIAEVWFGTHAGSPAFIKDDPSKSLQQAIGGHDLSFLLKILAADEPLSIQAHPTTAQAEAGFARENAAGIALNASNRNYKDAHHKPEIIVALTDFEMLCGFKPLGDIENLFADMASHESVSESFKSLVLHWKELLEKPEGLKQVFSDIIHRRGNLSGFNAELVALADFEARFALAEKLNQLYPGDPGVVVAMLMNHMIIKPGEAVFLPAGNIHAYLGGLGVELMASSDNVLRGGLTPKHIDVDELERVLDFRAAKIPLVAPKQIANRFVEYPCPEDDFVLYLAKPTAGETLDEIKLPGEAILLCTEGEVSISTADADPLRLKVGDAAYLSASAQNVSISGAGSVFLAAQPKPRTAKSL
ncbi:MAG: mannose-6-phosphate isomerase, class I [Rhodoluna sp.]